MVIQDLEQTTFLQMLGRKRFSDDKEQIYVYLCNISESQMIKYFQFKIQNIILFWFNLDKLQHRQPINNTPSTEITEFQSHYSSAPHGERGQEL